MVVRVLLLSGAAGEAASRGGFSKLGLARRCELRFLRRLLEAGDCEALRAALLEAASPQARACVMLLAALACGVCECIC